MSRLLSPARPRDAYAAASPGASPSPPLDDSSRPVTDRELEAVIALTPAELDGAFPSHRDGDHLVFDLGPARYRHDMRAALCASYGDPKRTACMVAALVWALADLVAPES